MKKNNFKCLSLFLVLLLALALVACNPRKVENEDVSIYFKNGNDYDVINFDFISTANENLTLYNLLYQAMDENDFNLEVENDFRIIQVQTLIADEDSKIVIYSTDNKNEHPDFVINVDGHKFYNTNKNISEIIIKRNIKYLFYLEEVNPKRQDPEYSLPVLPALEYNPNQTLGDIDLPEGWTWVDNEIIPTVDVDSYSAIFTPDDLEKFNIVTVDILLTITPATISVISPLPKRITYEEGLTLQDVELEEGWTWVNPDTVLSAGINNFKATLLIEDEVNYYPVVVDVLVDIKKANPNIEPLVINSFEYEAGQTLSDILLPKGWEWLDETEELLLGKHSYQAVYTPSDVENYQTVVVDVLIEAANPLVPIITTTLQNERIYANNKVVFDVWAQTNQGNKISTDDVIVTINGENAEISWDDMTKTSYIIEITEYENIILIVASDGEHTTSLELKIYYVPGDSSVTIAVEAFVIGCGYIVEPIQLLLNEELLLDMIDVLSLDMDIVSLKDSLTVAHLVLYTLESNGYEVEHWGTPTSGFYLSQIIGFNHSFQGSDYLVETLSQNGFEIFYGDSGDVLGEFIYTFGAGWMYAVNGLFPNVGMADYFVQDGDVIRIQFTLCFGMDINDASSMGWGYAEDYFELVNREDLTALLGYVNYHQIDNVSTLYDEALQIISTLGITQIDLDRVYAEILAEIGGSS